MGASGTIGSAVVSALLRAGHQPFAVLRPGTQVAAMAGVRTLTADVTAPTALAGALAEARPDAVISCIASRSGVAADAWAIDHAANVNALRAAEGAGAGQFILLSAICVQKPRLAFQHAKLAFEAELAASGIAYAIVRPTAFFKSLSGQIDRVRRGKPCLLFGDGRLTACKPISDRDLADYIAGCLGNPARANRILPIGGPGPAITPREQGEALFALTGQRPRFRSLPPGVLRGMSSTLRLIPGLAAKAELARIGHYYATESMLLLDPATGRYDADATPETGTDRLYDHYRAVLAGEAGAQRGAHSMF